jgi:NAD(P)-dependent dehydrogenase (short-subunit alcohol dehydrogenase family)
MAAPADSRRLSGKTALVTGGATGIGQAIVAALAGEGCRVAIAGRSREKLQKAADQWKQENPIHENLLVHSCDVADRQSVAALFDWATTQLGPIDILVNNAGVNSRTRLMSDMPPETWDKTLSINATGAYNCMYAVLPQMRSRRDGLIVNISSIAGKRVSLLGGAAYCASKFAMAALSLSVALEEGKNGIRVTTVYPGEVDTPILEDRPKPLTPEHRARILRPKDVADVVLCSACLPPRAHVPEMIVKPTWQDFA